MKLTPTFKLYIIGRKFIYNWKGNLPQIRFRYRKNILISRLYEQVSRNTPQLLQNGCQKEFQILKVYEHIIYHFKARNLEIPLI